MNHIHKLLILCNLFSITTFAYGQIDHIDHIVTFTSEIQISENKRNDGNIYNVLCEDVTEKTKEVGFPSLPMKSVKLIIPANAEITDIKINSIKDTTQNFLNYKIMPVQEAIPIGPVFKGETFVNTSKYKSIDFYPKKQVEIIDKGYFRGAQIVTVAVYPCQYFPNEDRLNIYGSINLSLEYKLNETLGENFSPTWDTQFIDILMNIIDNKNDITKISKENKNTSLRNSELRSSISTHSKYVIITNEALSSSFNEFMAWKRRKGLTIELVTIENIKKAYTGDLISGINDDAGKLRQFLSDAYKNGCEYTLLGGDMTILPIRYANYVISSSYEQKYMQIPNDLYFSDFDGNWDYNKNGIYGELSDKIDFYPEIYIGRILVNSPKEVETWSRKVLLYEQNPGNGDYAYLTKAFFTQADQLQEKDQANHVLKKATWVPASNKVVFSEEGGYDTSVTPSFPKGKDVIDEFNKHYGICSFMAHGGPTDIAVATKGKNQSPKYKISSLDSGYSGWPGADIPETGNGFDNMTNINHPSIYYSISCETAPFDNFGNIPEGNPNMARTYTSVIDGGGPTYLGNTRYGWVDESFQFFEEFVKAIANGNYCLGKAQVISKANRMNEKFNNYIKLTHNIIGCPETEIWTTIPSKFSSASVTESGNNVTVNAGVSNSTICVMSALDSGNNFYQVQQNVSSATFSNVPKPYIVTIIKHNYIPYQKNPDHIYIQNELISTMRYIKGNNISAGKNVTSTKTQGPVILKNKSNVIFDAANAVNLDGGFEIESGGTLKIK